MDPKDSPLQGDQLSDDDAIPKPLKINKKRHSLNLDNLMRSPSLTVPSSPTIQTLRNRPASHRTHGSLSALPSSTMQSLQNHSVTHRTHGSLSVPPSSTMQSLQNHSVTHRTHGSLSVLPSSTMQSLQKYPDTHRTHGSLSLPLSSTMQSLQNRAVIPTRNGSLPRSQSQVGILKKRITEGVNERNALRQGCNPVSNSNASASADSGKRLVDELMPRQRMQNDNQINSSPSRKGTNVSFDLSQLPHRAVTTGSRALVHIPTPLAESPTIPTALAPFLVKSRPRAFTISDIPKGESLDEPKKDLKRRSTLKERLMPSSTIGEVPRAEPFDQTSKKDVKRRSSIRERLMSRVRNGITSRPSISGGNARSEDGNTRDLHDGATRHDGVEATPHHRGENARDSSGRHSNASVADTVASVNTLSLFGSDLGHVLAVFPSPPQTPQIRATTITSNQSMQRKPLTFVAMSKPAIMRSMRTMRPKLTKLDGIGHAACEYVAMNGADLEAVSEIDNLNSGNGKSFFVAVEIKGTFGRTESKLRRPPFVGIEVAVIIDNSLFTSPATLMASCEAARHIAALLDMTEDKLTILCTFPLGENPQSRIVLPLSAVNNQRVKSSVDRIVSATELPDQRTTRAAIQCAMDMLTTTEQPTCAYNRTPSSFGQVFLLTANPSELPQDMLYHKNLQIHVVCPGSIPWKDNGNVGCNGWKLRSLYRNELEFMSRQRDMDATSLFNRLETVIITARRGIMGGKVTSLVLEINSGIDCSIVGVIGKKYHVSLRPGEVIVTLVKVNVGASSSTRSSTSLRQGSNSHPNSSDLIEELDQILEESSATLLTAKLQYSHSLFPPGTKCTIITEAPIKQRVTGTNVDQPDQATPEVNVSKEWVQKRLIYYLATNFSPRAAISTLNGYFSDGECDIVCPDYYGLIMEELRYQARIVERLHPSYLRSITADDNGDMYEHFGQRLFNVPKYKPQGWAQAIANDSEDDLDDLEQVNQKLQPSLPGQGLAVVYDPRVEGEWLANARHKAMNLNVPKTAGRALVLGTSDDDADDDGSDKSTIVGPSKYTLDSPSSKVTNHKPRLGFTNVPNENNASNSKPRLGLSSASNNKPRLGLPEIPPIPPIPAKSSARVYKPRPEFTNIPNESSASNSKPRPGFTNIPDENSARNYRPRIAFANMPDQSNSSRYKTTIMRFPDENSPFGSPTPASKLTKRTDPRRPLPINTPAVRSAHPHGQPGGYGLDRDPTTPTTPRVLKPLAPTQLQIKTEPPPQTQKLNAINSTPTKTTTEGADTSGSNTSGGNTSGGKTSGGKTSGGSKGLLGRWRKTSSGDSQKRFVGRQTGFPEVIIVKDDRERLEVMRSLAQSEGHGQGQGQESRLNLPLREDGGAGPGRGAGGFGGGIGGGSGMENRFGSGSGGGNGSGGKPRKPLGRGAGGGAWGVRG